MPMLKKIRSLLILWSCVYFGALFLINKTRNNLCFPGVKILWNPDKIWISPNAVKVKSPETKIHFDGIETDWKMLQMEINAIDMLAGRPYASIELSDIQNYCKFTPELFTHFLKKLKANLCASGPQWIKKFKLNGLVFQDNSNLTYTLNYEQTKNKGWSIHAYQIDKSNPETGVLAIRLNKGSSHGCLEISKNEQILVQANVAKSKRGNWLVQPTTNWPETNGFLIKPHKDRLLVYKKSGKEYLGWIDKEFKKCSVQANLTALSRFFPTFGKNKKTINLKYLLEGSNLMATISENKNPILTALCTNDFSTIKLLSNTDMLNHLIKLIDHSGKSYGHYFNGNGKLELCLENDALATKVKAYGKDLGLENGLMDNPIQSVLVQGQLEKSSGVGQINKAYFELDQGSLNLTKCVFKVNTGQSFLPETLFVSGKAKNFGVKIPSACSMTVDCDFLAIKNLSKIDTIINTKLCRGTINNNGLLEPDTPMSAKIKSLLPLGEAKIVILLSNQDPILVNSKDSSFALNFDLKCPIFLKNAPEEYVLKAFPTGKIGIKEGEFVILDNRFSISSGSILFNKKFNYKPIVDLQANSQIKKHSVQLNLFGPLNQPFANFRSNTNLSQEKIAAMIFSGHKEELVENQMIKIFPGFLVDIINKQMSGEKNSNKLLQKLGDALYIARNPTTNMKISPYLIESKLDKIGAALSFNPSPRFYASFKKDMLNNDSLIVDAEYLLGQTSSINISRDKAKTIKGEFEFKFKF